MSYNLRRGCPDVTTRNLDISHESCPRMLANVLRLNVCSQILFLRKIVLTLRYIQNMLAHTRRVSGLALGLQGAQKSRNHLGFRELTPARAVYVVNCGCDAGHKSR